MTSSQYAYTGYPPTHKIAFIADREQQQCISNPQQNPTRLSFPKRRPEHGGNAMPTTSTEIPILAQFLCIVDSRLKPGMPQQENARDTPPASTPTPADATCKPLPKGVVLGKDGKPCRSCTSVSAWMSMAKSQNPITATSSPSIAASRVAAMPATLAADCPPDVEALGRSTWTLLHTLTATYPERPSQTEQAQAKTFVQLFSSLYPCSHCAEDFRGWMSERGNQPRVGGREEFGRWMCEAHNAVNVKLGKEEFDCARWRERWRDGPADGRCG